MDRLITHFFQVLKVPKSCVTNVPNNKKNYKMHKIALVYLILAGFVLLFTKADPKIVLLQNINGTKVVISSLFLPTTNGTSFSLICKMIANEVNTTIKKPFDNRVVWSKKRKKSSIDDLPLMENSIPEATLNFTNISFKDQGIYYCISLQYKLSKALNLIVRAESPHITVKKEISTTKHPNKRTKHIGEHGTPARMHNNYTRHLTYNYPPIAQPSFDNELSSIYNTDYYNITNNEPDVLVAHTDPLLFFYVPIGFIFFITITCVAAKYRLNNSNESTPNSRNSQPRNQPVTNRNMCSHLVCIQNRSMHPFAECIMGTNDSRLPSSNNVNLRSNHLDLPPTYDISVDLSPTYDDDDDDLLPSYDDLPPTYDDVAANFARNSKCNLNIGNSVHTIQTINVCNNALPPSYDEALSSNVISSCSAGSSTATRSSYLNVGDSSDC